MVLRFNKCIIFLPLMFHPFLFNFRSEHTCCLPDVSRECCIRPRTHGGSGSLPPVGAAETKCQTVRAWQQDSSCRTRWFVKRWPLFRFVYGSRFPGIWIFFFCWRTVLFRHSHTSSHFRFANAISFRTWIYWWARNIVDSATLPTKRGTIPLGPDKNGVAGG